MNDAEVLAKLGTDARKWAEEFVSRKFDSVDEELIAVWFANAIEAGREAGIRQANSNKE